MNDALPRRLAALVGLALAATVAAWWLCATRIALDAGSDASRVAADALHAAWLVRPLALALLCVRSGAARGWHSGAAAALALIAPTWPVVLLAWSASAAPLAHVALAEGALLCTGAALPLLGRGVRLVLRRAEVSGLVAAGVGAALAAAVWYTRGVWAVPLP